MSKNRLPRGIRNNNPLNIRYVRKNNWQGRAPQKKDNAFEEFRSMAFGYRAAFMLMHKYIRLYNLHSIYDVVARWAPTADGNDVMNYAGRVSEKTSWGIFTDIEWTDWRFMVKMAVAMAEVENGVCMSYTPAVEGYISAAKALGYESIALEVTEQYNSIIAKL